MYQRNVNSIPCFHEVTRLNSEVKGSYCSARNRKILFKKIFKKKKEKKNDSTVLSRSKSSALFVSLKNQRSTRTYEGTNIDRTFEKVI